MGNSWTPGPWVLTSSGGYVMAGYAAGGYPIARMDDLEAPHALRAANARLIAVAPEMAEALDCVMTDMQCGDGTMTMATAGKVAALLARIRGDAT